MSDRLKRGSMQPSPAPSLAPAVGRAIHAPMPPMMRKGSASLRPSVKRNDRPNTLKITPTPSKNAAVKNVLQVEGDTRDRKARREWERRAHEQIFGSSAELSAGAGNCCLQLFALTSWAAFA